MCKTFPTAEKNKLFPSDMGMLVTDFLSANFDTIMDYGFTASVEKQFDEIANGNQAWQDMLTGFYGPFHSAVDTTMESAERVTGERSESDHCSQACMSSSSLMVSARATGQSGMPARRAASTNSGMAML